MTEVRNNTAEHRYEIFVEGKLAGFTEYDDNDSDLRTFTHTEVGDEYQGQGCAQRLVEAALDDTRTQHLGVLPDCKFVRKFIESNPQYVELVPPGARARYGLDRIAS